MDFKNTLEENKEFDINFYIENRDKYYKSSREWWDWEALRYYSTSTFTFLKWSMSRFIIKFDLLYSTEKIPDFLKCSDPTIFDKNYFNYDIEKMKKAENDLDDQYKLGSKSRYVFLDKSYHKPRSFIKSEAYKSSTVKKLHSRAMLAWACYYALEGCLPVKNVLDLKTMKKNDNKSDIDVIKIFALCEKSKYGYIKLDAKMTDSEQMESFKQEARPQQLYAGCKLIDLFDILLQDCGIGTKDIFDDTIKEIQPQLNAISENKLYKRIIGFYEHYVIMRKFISKLNFISYVYNKGETRSYAYNDYPRELFKSEEPVNMYERAQTYLKHCEKLLKDAEGLDESIITDIKYIQGRLIDAIAKASDNYRESHCLDFL